MGLSLFDLGKLLIIQEEQNNNTALKNSIDNLNDTIKAQQHVKAIPKTSIIENNYKYFTENKENYNTSGTLFNTEKYIVFKLFKVITPVEWNSLSILINNDTYMEGNFQYYNEIGLAYKDSNKNYVFNIMNEVYEEGVKVTIDNNLYINSFNIIGKYKLK